MIGPYRLLLELPELGEAIERVVVLGRPTLSRPVTRLLARPDVEVVLASPHPHWPVPPRAVHRVDLVEPAVGGPGDSDSARDRDWSDRWTRADAAARAALNDLLDAEPRPTGLTLARALARALRPGESLIAASSNPIRDLDLTGGALPEDVRVLANRGLAGIDGTVSTAIGHVLASGRPTRALVGDLAFLHDAGALLAPLGERRPQLQVVVLNDAGGGIFSLLEYGLLAEQDPAEQARFEWLFGTPHAASLQALCRGYGVTHRRADTRAEVDRVLARPDPGLSVVEVPADRATLRALHETLRDAVHAAVRAALQEAGASAPPAPAARPNP